MPDMAIKEFIVIVRDVNSYFAFKGLHLIMLGGHYAPINKQA